MQYEGKFKLRSHNTSYCLMQVATKTGLTALQTTQTHKYLISDENITLNVPLNFSKYGSCPGQEEIRGSVMDMIHLPRVLSLSAYDCKLNTISDFHDEVIFLNFISNLLNFVVSFIF